MKLTELYRTEHGGKTLIAVGNGSEKFASTLEERIGEWRGYKLESGSWTGSWPGKETWGFYALPEPDFHLFNAKGALAELGEGWELLMGDVLDQFHPDDDILIYNEGVAKFLTAPSFLPSEAGTIYARRKKEEEPLPDTTTDSAPESSQCEVPWITDLAPDEMCANSTQRVAVPSITNKKGWQTANFREVRFLKIPWMTVDQCEQYKVENPAPSPWPEHEVLDSGNVEKRRTDNPWIKHRPPTEEDADDDFDVAVPACRSKNRSNSSLLLFF